MTAPDVSAVDADGLLDQVCRVLLEHRDAAMTRARDAGNELGPTRRAYHHAVDYEGPDARDAAWRAQIRADLLSTRANAQVDALFALGAALLDLGVTPYRRAERVGYINPAATRAGTPS